MIYDVFIKVLEMSMMAAVISCIIIIMRRALKKHIPKGIFIVLWIVMLLKAVIPVELPSAVSIYNNIHIPFSTISHTSYISTEQVNSSNPAVQFNNPVIQTNNREVQSNNTKIPPVYLYDINPHGKGHNFVLPNENDFSPMILISIIWLTGAFLMLSILIIIYSLCYKRFSNAAPYEDADVTAFINKHSTANIKVYISNIVKTPVVFGIFRPFIILPEDFDKLDIMIKEHTLMHELQHIKHCDSVLNLLALLTLCIHWFNPLLWISYMLMIKDIESYCDERVIRQLGVEFRSEYAMSLLNSTMLRYSYASALTMGFGKVSIKERIVNVMDYKKARFLPTLISVILVITVVTMFATDAEPDIKPDDPPMYSPVKEIEPLDDNNDKLIDISTLVNDIVIHDTYENVSNDNSNKDVKKTTVRYLSYNRKAREITDENILRLEKDMTFEEILELLGDTKYAEGNHSNSRYLTYNYKGLELIVVDGWSTLNNKTYPQRSGTEILEQLKELLIDKPANCTGTVIILNT